MTGSYLDPGGEWCFKVRWPTLGKRNQVGARGSSLAKSGAIRAEHARIFAALMVADANQASNVFLPVNLMLAGLVFWPMRRGL